MNFKFWKKPKAEITQPTIYTEEEYYEFRKVISSPNGHYSWRHNEDGTVTEIDNWTGKESFH